MQLAELDAHFDIAAFPRVAGVLEARWERGVVAAQLYAAEHRAVRLDAALGAARPGVALRTDTLLPLFCAGKPFTAFLLGTLADRGLLDLDDPVARHLPAYATGGKEEVTLTHLLSHTVALAGGDPFDRMPFGPPADMVDVICTTALAPGTRPGAAALYSFHANWCILAEVACRCAAAPDFPALLREAALDPLGEEDVLLKLTEDDERRLGDRLGWLYDGAGPDPQPLAMTTYAGAGRACHPGTSTRAPARSLGRLYEELGRALAGESPMLTAATARALTATVRSGLYDPAVGDAFDWGRGVITDARFFGPRVGPGTFGHDGYRSSLGLLDPGRGVAIAVVLSGLRRDNLVVLRDLVTSILDDIADLDGRAPEQRPEPAHAASGPGPSAGPWPAPVPAEPGPAEPGPEGVRHVIGTDEWLARMERAARSAAARPDAPTWFNGTLRRFRLQFLVTGLPPAGGARRVAFSVHDGEVTISTRDFSEKQPYVLLTYERARELIPRVAAGDVGAATTAVTSGQVKVVGSMLKFLKFRLWAIPHSAYDARLAAEIRSFTA